MSNEKLDLVWELLPKIPMITKVAVSHLFSMSEQSKYMDLKTELIVNTIRAFLNPSHPKSITATQKIVNKDPGIKGRIWVSTYAAPVPPETSIRDALINAIDSLRHGDMLTLEFQLPDIVSVEAEWTGYRADATSESSLPSISEKEKYDEMMKEVKNPTTLLYLHGGAYWLMDPATHRDTTKKLAKLTNGRCYSVRYRLAPQHPFPAALLDALVSYLTLLYPPPGAFHTAVKPEHILFSGDSAGGNLSLALLQLVLELRRQNVKITWFGEERDIPLPAGVTTVSPWIDMTHSSPSCESNADFDYLPSLSGLDTLQLPKCPAWPTDPPRKALYVADSLITHPLVTLLMAQSWEGAPPVYVCTGWELLSDEDKLIARKLHQDGVRVVFEEYEGMPHCFAMIFPKNPGSKRCIEGWIGFIEKAVTDPSSIASKFTSVKAKTVEEIDLEPEKLGPYAEQEMKRRIYEKAGINVPAQSAGDSIAKL